MSATPQTFAPLVYTQYGLGFLDRERHELRMAQPGLVLVTSHGPLFWRAATLAEVGLFWAARAGVRATLVEFYERNQFTGD